MHILIIIATVIVIAVTVVVAVLIGMLWWAMSSKDGMR